MRWMTVVLIAFVPGQVFAQDSGPRWPGLKVSELSTVYVLDDAGVESRGRLVQFSPESLTLLVDGTERHFEAGHIVRIDRRGDSLRNGALIGAIVGAGMGLVTAGISDCPGGNPGGSCAGTRAGLFLFTTGVYTAIGTAIDALIVGRTTLYVAPTRTSAGSGTHWTTAPSGARAGVNLRFSW